MNQAQPSKRIALAAISQVVERNIIKPDETPLRTDKDIISWGDGNRYPDYLQELYKDSATLSSVIDGTADFICGDDIILQGHNPNEPISSDGMTIAQVIRRSALNELKYGGRAYEIIRTKDGKGIANVNPIDLRFLRCDKDRQTFYYSEHWGEFCRKRYITIPKFMPGENQERSILFITGNDSSTYPTPRYHAAVKGCEIERRIDDFHLNNLANGFMPSYFINFNNGVPEDEQRREIEDDVTEKFCGSENAGRVMIAFNETKENAITLEKVDVEDFGTKYDTLAKWSRQQIYSSFRANPNLFGIPTESLGFSSEEYESAFKLFNRTMVNPIQQGIADDFARIYNQDDILVINPFTLDGAGEGAVQ